MHASTLIATERYPLHDLDGAAGAALAETCRRRMRSTGLCRLPAFLSGAGLAALRDEARAVREHVHHSERYYTPYYREPDPSLPAGDPRASALRFAVGYVGRDRLRPDGAIETLFAWNPLLALVREALGAGPLYRFDDSLGSLNVTAMRPGDALGWHFDACEAVASLLLDACEGGGRFEYLRPFAGPEEARRARVSKVLRGGADDAIEVPMAPGDFVLFRGRRSLHRVTPVEGARERLMLLLSYDDRERRPAETRSNVDLFGRASAGSASGRSGPRERRDPPGAARGSDAAGR